MEILDKGTADQLVTLLEKLEAQNGKKPLVNKQISVGNIIVMVVLAISLIGFGLNMQNSIIDIGEDVEHVETDLEENYVTKLDALEKHSEIDGRIKTLEDKH